MNKSTFEIEIGGDVFTGWKRVAIDFDMEELSTAFSFTASDKTNILKELIPDTACKITIVNGNRRTLIVDGFIVTRDVTITDDNHEVTISGNDRLIDLVECSIFRKTKTWAKKRFSNIIKDLIDPHSIFLDASDLVDDPIIEKLTVQSGETVFDAIERLCRSQAVLPLSTLLGDLKLGYSSTIDSKIALTLGENIQQLRVNSDWSARFSEYLGVAQFPGNGRRWTKEVVNGAAAAIDREVTRYRPLLFIAENKMKKGDLQQRVNWEAQVRAGRSTVHSVSCSGFYSRDALGNETDLWEKNTLLTLKYGDTEEQLLVTAVSFTLDDQGENTVLTLKHPDTYKNDPSSKVELT